MFNYDLGYFFTSNSLGLERDSGGGAGGGGGGGGMTSPAMTPMILVTQYVIVSG